MALPTATTAPGRVRTTPRSSGCAMAGAPGCDPPMGGGRSVPVLGRGNPASPVSPRAKRSAPGARAGSQEGAQSTSMKANQPMGTAVHRDLLVLAGGGGGAEARRQGREYGSTGREPTPASKGRRIPGNDPIETKPTQWLQLLKNYLLHFKPRG